MPACARGRRSSTSAVTTPRSAGSTSCTTATSRSGGRSTRTSMLEPGERVLVAVSGGKDSLALWDILVRARLRGRRPLPRSRHRRLLRRVRSSTRAQFARAARPPAASRSTSPPTTATTSPSAAAATRRAPCGACGLSKRHLFNSAALEHGYDVVATGHNLDDEAAVLLGNVLRWETGYLGRQHPVLPAAPGFVRKVKPLVRLGEREIAAYCVLEGIDYQVEECPMAAGNRHLGYKEVLNALEDRSPGIEGGVPLRVPRARATSASPATPTHERDELRGVHGVRVAHARRRLRVLPTRGRRSARSSSPSEPVEQPGGALTWRGRSPPASACCSSTPSGAATSITLAEGGEFHTHAGVLAHDDAHRPADDGVTVRTTLRRAPRRGAADARRVRARDAARRAGDLPEGPRPDPDPRRHVPGRAGARVGRRLGRAHARAAPRGRAHGPRHRLRDPRRLRPPRRSATSRGSSAPTSRSTSRSATSTTASTSTTSTASCSTCPSRGGS